MAERRVIYGWQDGDHWFLSAFPYEGGRKPINVYATQQEAIVAVSRRKVRIEWQDIPVDRTERVDD